MQYLGTTRARFLRGGLVAAAGVAALPGSAAAKFGPNPVGDDLAYVQLLATAELVNVALADAALAASAGLGLSAGDKADIRAWRSADAEHLKRLRFPLQDEAPKKGDFDIAFPASATASRAGYVSAAIDLKRIVVGAALDGCAFAKDSGTRLLLGRIAAAETEHISALGRFGGRPLKAGLPASLDVQAAGTRLDRYLSSTVPS